MPLLPKQPNTLFNEIAWSDNHLSDQLLTNPYFFELLFCSDLTSNEAPGELHNLPTLALNTFHAARIKLTQLTRECPVIIHSVMQYKLMKGEFRSIEKEYKESLKITEHCFQVANLYSSVIKKYLTENSFRQPEQEIYFFKIIKPAFVSECDFLSLAYHALLFNKMKDKVASFWEREKQRKEKLLHEHADFFSIYLKGSTENDDVWFTRTGQEDFSSHDHIVSSWFAIIRYENLIESAILQSNKLHPPE